MGSILTANLKAMARHPHLVKLAEDFATQSPDSSHQVEMTKNHLPTLIIRQKDGKTFTYHSKYDPKAEAKKLVDSALTTHTHALLLGLGMGYTLLEVLSHLRPPCYPHQVIVVEPDPRVFFIAMSATDFREQLSDQRIDWCVGMNPDEFGEIFNASLDWSLLDHLAIIEHPPTLNRFPKYFEHLKEKIRYFCKRSKGNLVTLMYNGTEFLTNNFLNLPAIAHIPGVGRLFQKFSGTPAIVVAAGPSLERNVHLLKEVKGKFLIIAVDTAFRQLVERGIRPDIVCAADPSYLNSLDFVGVEEETDVILVFEAMVHPDIVRQFKGPKLITTFGTGILSLLEKFREPTGSLTCWGSIATTAFDMARKFACDPIIFIGLDLSFEDGRLYARGSYSDDLFYDRVHHLTSLEHETLDYINTRGVHQFPRPDGKLLFTDQNMNIYRGWFEDQFQQTSQTIINATEGGLVDRFVQRLTLRETIDRYESKSGPIQKILADALHEPIKVNLEGMQGKVTDIMNELHQDEKKAKEALSASRKLLSAWENTPVDKLTGPEKSQFLQVLNTHDALCQNQTTFAWFSVNQTRFITRHTQEITSLKNQPESTVGCWMTELKSFFETLLKFHRYQIPLLESGVRSMKEPGMLGKNRNTWERGTNVFAATI